MTASPSTCTGDMTINASAIFQPGHAATLSASNSLAVNGTFHGQRAADH